MSIDSLKHDSGRAEAHALELLIEEARRKARRRHLTFVVVLLVLVALGAILAAVVTGPRGPLRQKTASSGVVAGVKYKLNDVANLAGSNTFMASGSRIWVAINRESPTKNFYAVTELNARDGSLVRVIKDKGNGPLRQKVNGSSGDLSEPGTVTLSGSHLWVTDDQYWRVTELNARNGSLVRMIDAKDDHFADPGSIAVSGGHVWVTNSHDGANSVTELNESDGSLVKVLRSKAYGFSQPTMVAASEGRIYVLNSDGDSISEINARTGALVRRVNAHAGCCTYSQSTFEWAEPVTFTVSGAHLWIDDQHALANGGTLLSSIVELNAYSGSLQREIKLNRTGINVVRAMTIGDDHLWVQGGGNSIKELNLSNGSLVRTISTKLDPKGLNSSDGLAVGDGCLYVLNIYSGQKGSVTVINSSNGKMVRVIQ